MKKFKFAVNSWVFGPIPFDELVQRAVRIGLDGLEIDGEPDRADAVHMREALQASGLVPVSVCGTFSTENRAFNHSDPKMRQKAASYGKELVDMAATLGSDRVLLVPSQVNRLAYYAGRDSDWNHSVESIRQVAEYAGERGVKIMLECVNKYEVNLVYSLADGIRMAGEIGTGNVGLAADTFHMQLEEKDGIAAAIRRAGKEWILHQHLGDNNREVPGMGCLNWKEILRALIDIDYDGAVSFEPLPRHMTPEEISSGALSADELEREMTMSMRMLRAILELME